MISVASLLLRGGKAALLVAGAAGVVALLGIPGPWGPHGRAAPTNTTSNATVTRVVDGDTVDVLHDQRRRLRIRILGVNSPEMRSGDPQEKCWAQAAKEFATTALLDRRVEIVGDDTQAAVDRYGRTLAYVILDTGSNYSVDLARAGLARSMVVGRRPVAAHAQIVEAENEAQTARRGIWSEATCPSQGW